MIAKLKVEGPKTLNKAIEIGQTYEDMLNNNTNLINQTEYKTILGTRSSKAKLRQIQRKQQEFSDLHTPTRIASLPQQIRRRRLEKQAQ